MVIIYNHMCRFLIQYKSGMFINIVNLYSAVAAFKQCRVSICIAYGY